MNKIRHIWLYLLSFSLFLPANLNAESIGLLRFKPLGIESNITEAIYQLLESELISYGHMVISQEKIDEELGRKVECYNKQCAAETGIQMGLEKIIFGSLTKIGEKYIVSANVVESKSGEIVFSDKVTSKTAEDLDVCISRLAKSIEYGKEVEKTAEVGKITEEEMEIGAKRKKAFFASGLGFGMGMPVAGYEDTGNDVINYYGFKTWYETPKLAAELEWYLGSSGERLDFDLNEWSLGISLIYFLSTTDFSPYLSLGVERKSIAIDIFDYSSGLALQAGGGLVIFRTYDFRLVIDGKLSTAFFDVGEAEGPHSAMRIGVNLLYKKDKGGGCSGGCVGF
jgi:hypothetical protein